MPWWREGVVYQIYPRSFLDTTGDGVGDLAGVRRRLDHLAWLGVDAVWLSPIYRSPMADFGYNVADYTDVDPIFGTLDDADRLVAAAHDRDVRVVLDWVPNHTSDQHPWFVASRSSRDDDHRDFYIWRDGAPGGGPPNNWQAHFPAGPAWTYDEATGRYYLHLFTPQQPDLNWANPAVRAAMHDVLRFWLDRGIDGFRADVVHLIGKDPALGDDPPQLVGVPRAAFHDLEVTHGYLREIREVLDAYPGERMMVGEINLLDAAQVARYYGDGDELHLAFHFGLMWAPWEARSWRDIIRYVLSVYEPVGAWPTWVLGNHDTPRQVTRYGTVARARAAAMVLLTLRGTPFLYAGEELGLADAEVPDDRVVDPGGRDGCRAPIPWEPGPSHGWPTAEPWLPWPSDADRRNAASLREDPTSILHLYRDLIAARRDSTALRRGDLTLLDAGEDVLAYRRVDGDEVRTVVVNFADAPCTVDLPGDWRVTIATDRAGEGERFDGRLAPSRAVLLTPTQDT